MKGHPTFDQFASRVFDQLFKMGTVQNIATLTSVLNNNRTKFDSPNIADTKPPKPKHVKQMYVNLVKSYPVKGKDIEFKFQPAYLSPPIPYKYADAVFNTLYWMVIPDQASLIRVLNKHKRVFDKAQK
jgi:hypothetical protein